MIEHRDNNAKLVQKEMDRIEKRLKEFIRVPIAEMIEPPTDDGVYKLMTDRYWAVDMAHNLLFYKSLACPQCNSTEAITQMFIRNDGHPACGVRFISKVWIPHDCSDYK